MGVRRSRSSGDRYAGGRKWRTMVQWCTVARVVVVNGGTMVHGGTSGGGVRWCTVVHGGRMVHGGTTKWVICIYIQWVAPAKCEEQMYKDIFSAMYCPGGRRGPTRAACG